MAHPTHNPSLEKALRDIGPDATATFDNSASNPTERAGSESISAVADPDEDEDLEDDDENAAEEEEDDEVDEQEEVEDAARRNQA